MTLNTQTYQLELASSRIRVRQTLLVSGALHVMLLIWLLLYKPPVPIDLTSSNGRSTAQRSITGLTE